MMPGLMRLSARAAGLSAFALTTAVIIPRPSAHSRLSQVTWTKDVAPIVEKRCLGCHTPGGFGQIPLASYQDARHWAPQIREQVLERRMPPWPGARGFGDFSNDTSLSAIEIELLAAWALGNTPLGPTPAPSHAPDAVIARPPDLVLDVPAALAPGGGARRFELPTGQTVDRWITGWELRPGNRAVVERATLSIAPDIFVGTWAPPDTAILWRPGVGQRLPAGAGIALELRFRKSPEPVTTGHRLALYFGDRPQHELEHRSLPCGTTGIDFDIDVLAIQARGAGAGDSIEIVARRPDRTVEPLCVVPRYLPSYSGAFRFRKPVRLEAGTAIDVRSSSPGCGGELDFVRTQEKGEGRKPTGEGEKGRR